MAVGVEGGEPVAARLVDVDRVDLGADLVKQTVAQKAVFAPGRQDRNLRCVAPPRLEGGRFGIGENEFGLEIAVATLGRDVGCGPGQKRVWLEELLDIDLARRVGGGVVQKSAVVAVEWPVETRSRGRRDRS